MSIGVRIPLALVLSSTVWVAGCSPSLDHDDVVIGCVATRDDVDTAMRSAIELFEASGQRLAQISVAYSIPGIEIVVAPDTSDDERQDLQSLVGSAEGVVAVTTDRFDCP